MPEADDPKTVSTDERPQEGFYGRWSRRKSRRRAGGPGAAAPDPAPGAGAAPVADAGRAAVADGSAAAGADERVLTDDDMPDLDSLGEDADYSPFLSPGVSEALRRKALRRLFASPVYNVTDGLNDYDDDFTTFEPLGDIVTSDMRHRMEREAEEAEARARAEADAQEQVAAQDGEPAQADAAEPDDAARRGAAAADGEAVQEREAARVDETDAGPHDEAAPPGRAPAARAEPVPRSGEGREPEPATDAAPEAGAGDAQRGARDER